MRKLNPSLLLAVTAAAGSLWGLENQTLGSHHGSGKPSKIRRPRLIIDKALGGLVDMNSTPRRVRQAAHVMRRRFTMLGKIIDMRTV